MIASPFSAAHPTSALSDSVRHLTRGMRTVKSEDSQRPGARFFHTNGGGRQQRDKTRHGTRARDCECVLDCAIHAQTAGL